MAILSAEYDTSAKPAPTPKPEVVLPVSPTASAALLIISQQLEPLSFYERVIVLCSAVAGFVIDQHPQTNAVDQRLSLLQRLGVLMGMQLAQYHFQRIRTH